MMSAHFSWAQVAWGLILASILWISFRRAWRWEQGKNPDQIVSEKNGRETYVLLPATTLFWIILCLVVLAIFIHGFNEGLLLSAMFAGDVMILLSIYFVLLLVTLPLLRKTISARACAILWVIPALLSWQIYILITAQPAPLKTIYIPREILTYIGIVWAVGFIVVGGYYLVSHITFRKWVKENTCEETSEEILALLNRMKEEMIYRRPVKLLRGDVASPFSMGQTKWGRSMVLPNRNYTCEELEMIFSHEIHHLQRCDVDTKVFLCLCNALCWFNPLVWIATKKAAEDLERSCDEIVTESMSDDERKAYANLLLESAGPTRGCTTCLSAAAATLRYRLTSVMNQKKRFLGTAFLATAMFLCVMAFGRITFSDMRGSFTELILPANTELDHVIDCNHYQLIREWDDDALKDILSSLEVDHIPGLRNQHNWVSEEIFFAVKDGRSITIQNRGYIFVEPYYSDEDELNINDMPLGCFVITSDFDWDALKNCIGIE